MQLDADQTPEGHGTQHLEGFISTYVRDEAV